MEDKSLQIANTCLQRLYCNLSFDVSKLKNKNGMATYCQLQKDLDMTQIANMGRLDSLLKNIDQYKMAYKGNEALPILRWEKRVRDIEEGWMLLEKIPLEERNVSVFLVSGKGEKKVQIDEEELERRTEARMTQDVEDIFGKGLPGFRFGKKNSLYWYKLNEFYGMSGSLDRGESLKSISYKEVLLEREKQLINCWKRPEFPMPQIDPQRHRGRQFDRT